MKPGGGKAKGHRFELDVAKEFQQYFGLSPKQCFRTPMSGGHYALRETGPGDIQFCIPFQASLQTPLCVECKNHAEFDLVHFWDRDLESTKLVEAEALRQVLRDAGDTWCPLLIFKYRQRVFACVPVDEFQYSFGMGLVFHFQGRTFTLVHLQDAFGWLSNQMRRKIHVV